MLLCVVHYRDLFAMQHYWSRYISLVYGCWFAMNSRDMLLALNLDCEDSTEARNSEWHARSRTFPNMVI